jgi:hypothetical protein
MTELSQYGSNGGARLQDAVICAATAGVSEVGRGFDRAPNHLVRAIRKYCHIVPGAFTPVLAKHSKHFSLVDVLSIGIDRIQRNFFTGPSRNEGLRRRRRSV